MIIYVETQSFMRPILSGDNVQVAIDEVVDANWSKVNVLAIEEGDVVDLIFLREKFKEFRKRGDWYAYVPTVQEYVKSLPSFGKYVESPEKLSTFGRAYNHSPMPISSFQ